MDITKMSVEQLKALAYDRMKLGNQVQEELRVLQQEIEKRSSGEVPTVPKEVPVKEEEDGKKKK